MYVFWRSYLACSGATPDSALRDYFYLDSKFHVNAGIELSLPACKA